jgi:cell division protein FtsW (lipid II flippase)
LSSVEREETVRVVSTLRRVFDRRSRLSRRGQEFLISAVRLLIAFPIMLLIAIISAWWFDAISVAMDEPGETFQLESLVFTLPRGSELRVGRQHLMQPPGQESAEIEHVRFRHTATNEIRISNSAKERRLGVVPADSDSSVSADRLELTGPAGQSTRIVIGDRHIDFRNVSAEGFDVEIDGAKFHAATAPGWNDIRGLGPAGKLGDELPTCVGPTWLDSLQSYIARPAVALGRGLDQPILYVGGDRSCRTRKAFQLALGSSAAADELSVNLVVQGRATSTPRLFIVPVNRQAEEVVTVQRYPPGCNIGDAGCRLPVQSGVSGSSWLVAPGPNPPSHDTPVWRFVAGRTVYDMRLDPVGSRDSGGRFASMRVTVTPRSNVPHFSATRCKWFLSSEGTPPAITPNEDVLCPERHAVPPKGVALEVKPTAPGRLFDQQVRARPLGAIESLGRSALLAIAVLIAFLLAIPAAGTARRRSWPSAVFGRILRIWPVCLSVAIAAIPALFAGQITARQAFALTIANWAFVGMVLSRVPRSGRWLGLMWAVLAGLAAIGSVSLATLGADIGTTRGANWLIKHKLLFLDLLPPAVLAVVPARYDALRPLLASIVLDNRAQYAAVRWLPPIALIGLFALWLAIGTQLGFGEFQPVEGGKFWFVVMSGAVLVSLEKNSRALALSSFASSRLFAVAIVLAFVAALYLVPFIRNDYSPLLIISASGAVLILVRFVPDIWRWVVAKFGRLSEFMHLPMRMRPPVYERFLPWLWPRAPRGAKFAIGIGSLASGLIATTAIVLVSGGALLALALRLDRPEWPHERGDRLSLLEQSLGLGRRVPIERFLTWIDLDYDATETAADRPRVRYRDIGFQLIRSRVEIEDADCLMSKAMQGRGGAFGDGPSKMIAAFVKAAAKLFSMDLSPDSALCHRGEQSDEADPPTAAAILVPKGPETIPVAESDFAAAYLIARHGIASAVLLFAFQFTFIVLAMLTYLRLIRVRGGDTSDQIVRYLLSVLLAGAATLFVLQWSLAWANSLGLLPVMGQPMTWLSAGASHHLFLALPCSITILLAIRYMVPPPTRRPLRAPPL